MGGMGHDTVCGCLKNVSSDPQLIRVSSGLLLLGPISLRRQKGGRQGSVAGGRIFHTGPMCVEGPRHGEESHGGGLLLLRETDGQTDSGLTPFSLPGPKVLAQPYLLLQPGLN